MCRNPFIRRVAGQAPGRMHPSRAQGSALMVALFALVVIAALGAALVKLLESQSQQVLSEVLAVRALAAARAGAEARLVYHFPLDAAARHCDGTSDSDDLADGTQFGPVTTTLTLPDNDGFAGCGTVTVSCTSFRVAGQGVIRLTSTARCGSSGDDGVSVTREVNLEARVP